MKKIYLVNFAELIILLVLFSAPAFKIVAQDDLQGEINSYLTDLPFDSPEIIVPEFPDKIYNIKDFGARGDGLFKNTEAFQNAINECSKGGGKVIVPAGVWLTGPIEMKSNVNLHLEKGALVIFSPDHKDFPLIQKLGSRSYDVMNPIYGINIENVAITGEGIFDGNGQTWRPVKKFKMTSSQWKALIDTGGVVNDKGNMWWPNEDAMNAEKYLSERKRSNLTKEDYEKVKDFNRPYLLLFENSQNILLSEITLQNSPKFAMYLRRCENAVVRKVRVMNEWWAQNGDGLDLSACKNVLMYGCTVDAGDDGICMKSSGKPKDAPAMENIIIADCVVYHGHGGFVIGSNTDGGIRNISVRNCIFISTDTGLRFKSGVGRGGIVENIFIDGIYMKDIKEEAVIFNTGYSDAAAVKMIGDKKDVKDVPEFRNIYMNDIICDGTGTAFLAEGLEIQPVEEIYVSNSTIKSDKGFIASEAIGFTFDNVKFFPKEGSVFKLNNTSNFVLKNIFYPEKIQNFMMLNGAKTDKIMILDTILHNGKASIKYSNEVPESAVSIKND